jgi:hypothetical protein
MQLLEMSSRAQVFKERAKAPSHHLSLNPRIKPVPPTLQLMVKFLKLQHVSGPEPLL